MDTYQKIELEDYFQTGEGGTALTYNKKDGTSLAKLFVPGVQAQTASREFHVNEIVYELGIPTPKPLRLITDGTRYGAEYELIPGKRSFTRIISQEPEQLEPLSVRFAVLARELHSKQADTCRLPSMKELVRDRIIRYKMLPENVREMALSRLEGIPEADTCLHGDLHIGNIITDGKKTLWIDVGDFAYGRPEWDLCMLYYSANFLSPERAENIFHLDMPTLHRHWEVFARAYYQTDSQEELDARIRGLHPFVATKMAFVIAKMRDGKGPVSDGLLQLFDRYLQF